MSAFIVSEYVVLKSVCKKKKREGINGPQVARGEERGKGMEV